MKTLAIILSAFVLSACSLTNPFRMPPEIQVVRVEVPVIVPIPSPPVVERPTLISNTVSINTDGYAEFVRALQIDLMNLRLYAVELEAIVREYDRASKQSQELSRINGER